MARKSLSAQVIEEVDRLRGLLKPVQDITDPMTSHLVGTALASAQRIEDMCLNALQKQMNAVLGGNPIATVEISEETAAKPLPRRAATHKSPRARKAVEKP